MARYTMDVGEDFEVVLGGLARRNGISKAEVIRRAVASYAYFTRQLELIGNGSKVSITDANDRVLKDVVLP